MASNVNVIEVDDATFEQEVLATDVPVLVDFVGQWCGPCKAMAPTVERVAIETLGKVKVVTVDADASLKTAKRYGIRGVPTLVVFRRGERTAQHVGTATRDRVMAMLGG